MANSVQCFDKKVCGYFNEDGLAALTYSSWHRLAGLHPDDGLQLDAKLDLVKQNLTKFEKSLRDRRVNHIPAFLKNNGLQHLLVHREVVTAVCSYLLYVVSCHSEPVIVNSASNTLSYHVENGAVFAPDRSQILAIALNMGMKEEFLPPDFSREELPQYVREEGSANSQSRAEYPEPFHVRQVVSCLTELLQLGRGWTDTARDALFSVLRAMVVDPYMNNILVTPHVTICIDRLVNSYEKTVWTDYKMLDLVERLGDLPRAARLPLLRGLPRLGRGLALRRVTAYFYLQHAISEQDPERTRSEASTFDLPYSVTVADILAALRGEQDLPPATFSSATIDDLENFFMLLSCSDVAVGSERLPNSQLEHLRQLMRLMQKKVDQVKDDNDKTCMLRIQLKELMTVLNSKWTRMSQKPVIQTTLDNWSQ